MDVPKILETPFVPLTSDAKSKVAPYKVEIDMLRNGTFKPEHIEALKG